MRPPFHLSLGVLTVFLGACLVTASNATDACPCKTASCPEVGTNTLTVGSGKKATYVYVSHGGIPVVSSASVTITPSDLDKGSDTTSCTQEYARQLEDDGSQVRGFPPM